MVETRSFVWKTSAMWKSKKGTGG